MRRTTDWGVMVYTFHPYVSGRGHRMMMMEQLIDGLTAMGAEFRTLDEVQQEYRARQAS
jgi:peptidoglycan/xylan/chitin deacetylase (PgdA/CDA1 family)